MVLSLAGEKKVKIIMLKVKGKLWGFQKKEVEDHIEKLEKDQEAELEELSDKIQKCQSENDILRQELSTLTETNASFPEGILLELALNRIDRIAGFIDQDVDIEVLAIDKITHQKSIVLESTIADIDKDIDKEKIIIEKELKNIVEIAKRQERTKNIDLEVMKNIGKLLPIADWLKSNREEQNNPEKAWEEDSADSMQELIKQMTADGTIPEPLIKPDTTKANVENQNSKRSSASDLEVLTNLMKAGLRDNKDKKDEKDGRVYKDDKLDANSRIWSYNDGTPEIVEPYSSISKPDFWHVSVVGEDNPNPNPNPNPSSQEVAVTEDSETKVASQEYYQSMETSAAQSEEPQSEQSQAGVRGEISAVRAKYILGKVAGEDIIGASGQVIVRKGNPITVNVMNMAQNEGKLADLIINMESPGQDA